MERSCFSRRITVDSDNSTYPCSSAYIAEHGRLWWEFEFLHSSLVDRGLTKRLCKFEAECASTLRGKVSDGEYHLGLKDVPTSHIARIVTSNALLNVLAHVFRRQGRRPISLPFSPSADHLRCRSSSACPFRRGSESGQSADWVCLHDQ